MCYMVKSTKRDQIWQLAVKRTIRGSRRITVDEVLEVIEVSPTTARDTLNTMAEYDILERRSKMDGAVYYTANQGFIADLVENY